MEGKKLRERRSKRRKVKKKVKSKSEIFEGIDDK